MADMTNTRLELCNMIRMEAEHISDTGFPLDVFPQAVQSVILDMDRYENYKTEFIATAMISAVSAALGGTYRIRIKGEWQSNAGRVLTRGQLIDRIWGADYVGDTKTLDVHVKRLRSKIEEEPSRPRYLVTVRGLGYKFEL